MEEALVAIGGAIIVAFITAVTTDRRLAPQLDAEAKRQERVSAISGTIAGTPATRPTAEDRLLARCRRCSPAIPGRLSSGANYLGAGYAS